MDDKMLLTLLQTNARMEVMDLAAALDETEDNIINRLNELEKEKVICGYPTLINWEKVEQDERVTAIIEVKVTPQRGQGFDRIAERIYKFDEVADVYLISGNYDLVVILEGKSMREKINLPTLKFVLKWPVPRRVGTPFFFYPLLGNSSCWLP